MIKQFLIKKKTPMITKIIDTVHTVGIDSFSMYEHFTRPSDGIPKYESNVCFNYSYVHTHASPSPAGI